MRAHERASLQKIDTHRKYFLCLIGVRIACHEHTWKFFSVVYTSKHRCSQQFIDKKNIIIIFIHPKQRESSQSGSCDLTGFVSRAKISLLVFFLLSSFFVNKFLFCNEQLITISSYYFRCY